MNIQVNRKAGSIKYVNLLQTILFVLEILTQCQFIFVFVFEIEAYLINNKHRMKNITQLC